MRGADGNPSEEQAVEAPLGAQALARYSVALRRYLVRRVFSTEDVDDLLQEIFTLFIHRKSRPDVIHNPLAYLFRIAFNVLNEMRADHKRQAEQFVSEAVYQDDERVQGFTSGEEAEELAVESDVRAALEKLPAGYLTALLLVVGKGMSYKEAARATGYTPTTIATYVMNARAALKLALEGTRDKDGARP